MFGDSFIHRPHWFWIPVRVLLVTLLFALMAFAVSLFLGIITAVIVAEIRNAPRDLQLVYRHLAPFVAGLVGVCALIYSAALEVQHYRQVKALSAIERVS